MTTEFVVYIQYFIRLYMISLLDQMSANLNMYVLKFYCVVLQRLNDKVAEEIDDVEMRLHRLEADLGEFLVETFLICWYSGALYVFAAWKHSLHFIMWAYPSYEQQNIHKVFLIWLPN